MKERIVTTILGALVLLLLVLYFGKVLELSGLEAENSQLSIRADSIAAEAAAARAEAEGWEVRFAEADPEGMERALSEQGEELRRLSADLRASRVRIESLSRVIAEGSGSGETDVEVVEEESLAELSPPSQELRGEIRDEVLTLDWRLRPNPFRFSYDYSVSLPCELLSSRTGDGRLMVTARSLIPEVASCRVDDLVFDPLPPEVLRKTDWRGAFKWASIGAGILCLFKC